MAVSWVYEDVFDFGPEPEPSTQAFELLRDALNHSL
jgi:hypothetical protein